jgi:hypothetical protein
MSTSIDKWRLQGETTAFSGPGNAARMTGEGVLAARTARFTEMTMVPNTTDVLIVGAGPTGLAMTMAQLAHGQNASQAAVIHPRPSRCSTRSAFLKRWLSAD